MTSGIKPPGSGPATGAGTPGEVGGPKAADETFRDELSKTEGAAAGRAAGTSRADVLRALADDIRAGRLDPQQAIERLIERALSTGPAAALPPARRAELEALLRAQLEDDPTLSAMQRDLARGR